MQLVSAIVSESFYEELRTRQQLGYIVSSGVSPNGKALSMAFIVQSSTAKNEKLTTEIIKYIDCIRSNYLEILSNAQLGVYVKSLIDQKTEPDKQLSAEVTRNWAEISSGRKQFDRSRREVAALLDLTKDDLLQFWDQLYVNDGRRVLITEMIPQVGVTSGPKPSKTNNFTTRSPSSTSGIVLGINDIEVYRQAQSRMSTIDMITQNVIYRGIG